VNLQESCSVVNKLLWPKYVYDSKRRRRFYQSTGTPKRTEQNLIVRIDKSEAEVTDTIIKDCTRGIVLLKLMTDTLQTNTVAPLAQPRLSQQNFLLAIGGTQCLPCCSIAQTHAIGGTQCVVHNVCRAAL